MKGLSFRPRRLLVDCALVVLAHFVLLQVMAHTRVIEKVMALQFSATEMILIAGFILVRLAAYFVVPAVLASLLAGELLRRISLRRRS